MLTAADHAKLFLQVAARRAAKLPAWTPQPGPQTDLFNCEADEILFGGAAGGGKSAAIVALTTQRIKMRGYRALILRRATTHLKNLIDEVKSIYQDGRETGKFAFAPFAPGGQSRFNGKDLWMICDQWGSRVEFGHCFNEDDYRDHMGQQYDDVIFDEGTQFTRQQYENIITRRRGTIAGIRRRAIVTANPPESTEPGEEWVRQKWAPWIDPSCKVETWEGLDEGGNDVRGQYIPPRTVRLVGLPERPGKAPAESGQILYVIKDANGNERFSAAPFVWNGISAERRTFIRSLLRDNQAMAETDPNYVGKLRQADAVRAKQLEDGDWTVRRIAGTMFNRTWFEIVDAIDEAQVVGDVRAWDKAATEPTAINPNPDWTRGVRAAKLRDGTIVVRDVASCRASPGERDAYIKSTAELDGQGVRIRGPQDPAAAGKSDVVAFRKLLDKWHVVTYPVSGNKVLRAGPTSSLANPKSTGGAFGRIKVLRGDWNAAFFGEIESFPDGKHDDIVDAFSDAIDELQNHMRTAPPPKPPPAPKPYNFDAQRLGI